MRFDTGVRGGEKQTIDPIDDYFDMSKAPLTSSLNHCPKSRSKLRSPSVGNNCASKPSSEDATDWIKSFENKFGAIASGPVDDGPPKFIDPGLLRIEDGEGAVIPWFGPGAGVGGAVPPWGTLPMFWPG